ncbi:MAG: protein kinase [Cyanobacteria bacterium]|nr:protein kinase [Cyanobacteriota bacterium]
MPAPRTVNPIESLVGQTLADRYVVESIIGSGGLGIVFRCCDKQLDRVVAVKVMLPGSILQQDSVARFQREASASIALRHPHIAAVQEFGIQEKRFPYLVMEYVDGVPLSQLLKREGRLDGRRAFRLIKQCAEALAYVHSNRIVHRDLKPDNILVRELDEGDDIQLIDWGIARSLEDESKSITQTGEIFGTPAYMSPEQCRGERVSYATDVYSLGCIAYELLTGEQLFAADSAIATIMKHLNEPAPKLTTIIEKPGFERVIDKALEREQSDRYSTAAEVLADLELVDKGEKVQKTNLFKGASKGWKGAGAGTKYGIIAVIILLLAVISGFWTFKDIARSPGSSKGNLEAALAEISGAIDRFENINGRSDQTQYLVRAEINYEMGRYRDAENDLKVSNLQSLKARGLKAKTLLAQGKTDEASDVVRLLLRENPNLPDALICNAGICQKKGHQELGGDYLAKAIEFGASEHDIKCLGLADLRDSIRQKKVPGKIESTKN